MAETLNTAIAAHAAPHGNSARLASRMAARACHVTIGSSIVGIVGSLSQSLTGSKPNTHSLLP